MGVEGGDEVDGINVPCRQVLKTTTTTLITGPLQGKQKPRLFRVPAKPEKWEEIISLYLQCETLYYCGSTFFASASTSKTIRVLIMSSGKCNTLSSIENGRGMVII